MTVLDDVFFFNVEGASVNRFRLEVQILNSGFWLKVEFFKSKFDDFFQPMFHIVFFSGSTWEMVFQPAKKFTTESMHLSWVVFSCEYTLNWKGYTNQFRAFISTVCFQVISDFRLLKFFLNDALKRFNLKTENHAFSQTKCRHNPAHFA